MKIKSLVSAAAMAFAALCGVSASAEVSGGDIYSVDLVNEFDGIIPSKEHPLTIGEKVTVRVRLTNRQDGDGKWLPWRFVSASLLAGADASESNFRPQLGLMLGGQQVYADFYGSRDVVVGNPKKATMTDFFFQYTVKSGDLALPARFMTVDGKAVSGDDDATDYAIRYGNYLGGYWKISNDQGDDCTGEGKFHFGDNPPNPDPDSTYEAGEPHRYITGTGLGIYVETVNFDANYFEDPDVMAGTEGIWRKLYAGMTQSLPSVPTVKVDGTAEAAATMYIWVEDPTIANVLSADNPEVITGPKVGGVDLVRYVIKVPIAKGASSANFRLQGKAVGTTHVRMSSSRELSTDKSGNLIEDWVERPLTVTEPPDPSVLIEVLNPAGDPLEKNTVTLNADYTEVAAIIRLTLTQKPSADLHVTLDAALDDGDIFEDGLLGISESTDGTPWENEVLDFTVGPNDMLTKTLYVYTKGTTAKMSTRGVKFTVETSGAPEFDPESGKHSSNLVVKYMNPVLVKPAAGDAITDAMAGKNYPLDIAISDARKHMVDAAEGDAPYTVYYKVEAPGTEGEWDFDDAVFLNDADSGESTISVPFDIEGECNLLLYVLSPSGKKSPTTTIPVTVAAPKRATVTLDRENGVYAEGETAYVNFHLTQKYKNALYAFLVPQDDETRAKFDTDISSETAGAIGYYIGPNETDTKIPVEVAVKDGKSIGRYQVFMCTDKNYSKTKSAGYIGDIFGITATNVVPAITSASMGGTKVKDGGIITKAVAQGVTKKFEIEVAEPGLPDLDATGADAFLTQWKFGSGEWEDMYGNPNKKETYLEHAFTSPGDYDIEVRCQDKDMRALGKWSASYTFKMTVLDIPRVVITPVQDTKQYYEDQTGIDSAFSVSLTAAPEIADVTQRLKVAIVKELLGDPSKYSTDDLVLSKDIVEFSSGRSDGQSFFLKSLDGTAESAGSGFRLTAKVINPEIDTEGKIWEDGETEVYILNHPPSIKSPTQSVDKDDKPIPTMTAIGTENKLSWIIGDVAADHRLMTVTWMTSEGETVTYRQGDPGWDDVMTGTHTFKFMSAGDKTITLTATDKDGDSESRIFYYTIEASKSMTMVPHGPAGGYGTVNSKRYRTAAGLGEGRVYARNLSSVEGFKSLFNCGVSATWDAYAYGYKVGDIDDGKNLHKIDGSLGYYLDRDQPITQDGNVLVAGGAAYKYPNYPDAHGAKAAQWADSFLYTWLQIAHNSDGGNASSHSSMTDELLGKTVQPEYTEVKDTGVTVVLPSQQDQNTKSYAETTLEAIFSREYLATDNMGDINQDGIPDIYIDKYDLLGANSAAGGTTSTISVDDLKPVNLENHGNDDEDYLPRYGISAYSSLIPGLPSSWADGTPFSAKMEIRGYGEGLNDATELVGLTGVKPERCYTDPRTDPRSTLDGLDPNGSGEPVEYLAWIEFATREGLDPTDKTNWTKWSPERPTDPTLADTDDDGFSDGYEYFFWYRAHVGYMDGGTHRYQTGRAYDPKNPGTGKFISREEIERLMDPIVPCGDATAAKYRDTDNDGIPDLLEFDLGTNPFDFDTDGDGLPDGFEFVCGTDPLNAFTNEGISDAMRNYDGDAMAFTTPGQEEGGFVLPKPVKTDAIISLAVADPEGDTDGVQWYVTKDEGLVVSLSEATDGQIFTVGEKEDEMVTYLTTATGNLATPDNYLAIDLLPENTWVVEKAGVLTNSEAFAEISASNPDLLIRLMPTHLEAGLKLNGAPTSGSATTVVLDSVLEDCHTAWVYGNGEVSCATTSDGLAVAGGFGCLAIGREGVAPTGVALVALPTEDKNVAYLHYLVYQEFGFDPRTAWNPMTPIGVRYAKMIDNGGEEGEDGEAAEDEMMANNYLGKAGYVGVSTRTREYTLYDEFLVMSFFLNNGTLDMVEVTATEAYPWQKIWSKYTTNGQGPNEPEWDLSGYPEGVVPFKGRTAETASGTNGADTDEDGVPDGWELYVMSGPKKKGDDKKFKFKFVGPREDGHYSNFGPFIGKADSASATDNNATGAEDYKAGDGDGLTELREFAGTDSCKYYAEPWAGNEAAFSTTIVRPEVDKNWLNKFLPTDPWNPDTDGDGVKDEMEKKAFSYGTPADDGKMLSIPGGGLNPCTVDTDQDGLPDPWEKAYAGGKIYDDMDQVRYAVSPDATSTGGDAGKEPFGNPLQGLCDGMDGTVFDAYNSPRIATTTTGGVTKDLLVILNGVPQTVDRDYDHDGLENWQEYLTCQMRCWRYDDTVSPWTYFPEGFYSHIDDAVIETGCEDKEEFWYQTLFNKKSPLYNPHLVTGMASGAQYWSRVSNGWDHVYTPAGSYYMFPDKLDGEPYKKIWGLKYAPKNYAGTSPILADTDLDGMDDGWELFHGLNPILGESGIPTGHEEPCDLIFMSYGKHKDMEARCNKWCPYGVEAEDFEKYPWLNGIWGNDPDGDDIRNQDEAIMPLIAPSATWYHTDPSPLWMTDSSYTNSLVRRFYRLPVGPEKITVPKKVEYKGKVYYTRDVPGVVNGKTKMFLPDFWLITKTHYELTYRNWILSFEENEGYDTDHDTGSDYEELQAKYRAKSDPQDADSPRRRQAMYFQGPENPSALQSTPFVIEKYPRALKTWPDDMEFLQYTVDCWVRPESKADSTVIERAVYSGVSHKADEQYLRCNFRIAIKNGKWYTMFDPDGTVANAQVEVQSVDDVELNKWTYVAATYDADQLILYVDGVRVASVKSSLKPTDNTAAVVVYPGLKTLEPLGEGDKPKDGEDTTAEGVEGDLDGIGHENEYHFDMEYETYAFLIGASFKNEVDLGYSESAHMNVHNGAGWDYYRDFFKGYVDEVRVWDGAVSVDEIRENYRLRKRFTREDAIANRDAFYGQWAVGKRRYMKNSDGTDMVVMPELRYHWSFDSIPGAENAASVDPAPGGFTYGPKAPYSSPEGYQIPWWKDVVEGTGFNTGYGSVYAGLLNWVTWIPNTVTHLPRFDGSTLDSFYWSVDHAGIEPGSYYFALTAEPVSRWTQYIRNGTKSNAQFQTSPRRFWQTHVTGTNTVTDSSVHFDFNGRHLNQLGDDLLPLGGAFAKYIDEMWDDLGASTMWERTGIDVDNDGLPDWWQEYADQNYREGLDPEVAITWSTPIVYEIGGVKITIPAYEAYLRDLAKGFYVDAEGVPQVGPTRFAQSAKSDGLIPDWWKSLYKIDAAGPFDDVDNDGLSNYAEYIASELLPFRLLLDPSKSMSGGGVLDYFRKPFVEGCQLYVGEMLTDHDQMEDHWERSLGDDGIANAALWDATKDADGDGWTNFEENRYNGYSMSTLAQLVSHAVGNNEVLDAPIPTLHMKVHYAGTHFSTGEAGEGEAKKGEEAETGIAPLVVRTYTREPNTGAYSHQKDAQWTVPCGETIEGVVYLGGWEDRIVRGTMTPGNVDIASIDLEFAQVPQSDLYSWTDQNGLHVSMSYAEFKAALAKNPGIIQNIEQGGDGFTWLHLAAPVSAFATSDKAVTVTRDSLQQTGYIAVYGERVGTIDLTTGDFSFDLAAMNALSPNYTYGADGGPASAWGYKEAVFRLTYKARVPTLQQKVCAISLGRADAGFVRGGQNMIEAFYDLDGDGLYTPGEPFGVLTDVEIGWASRDIDIELGDMSAIAPRVDLWNDASDRADRVGAATFTDGSNRFEIATAPAPKSRVSVVRYKIDSEPVYRVGVNAGIVLDRTFESEAKNYLQEGEFLQNGALDIDWNDLYGDVTSWSGALRGGCQVTNVTYLVTFNWDKNEYESDSDTNSQVRALSTLVTRRFEVDRTIPTAHPERSVCNLVRPTFAWSIDNEDAWASWFGTTYTAFKVRIHDLDGNLVYDSGIRRLPVKGIDGIYRWTAPIYAGSVVPGTGVMFKNLESYTWEVAVYNAKFSTDDLLSVKNNRLNTGRAFSKAETFRMNVTTTDASSQRLAVRVCYNGPAKDLLNKVCVQAFTSPDFTGDPASEATLRYVAEEDSLSPAGTDANIELFGLPAGEYFLRAYIDTNGNGIHDDWESWGYLSERDNAGKRNIFVPETMATALMPKRAGARKLYIEDCDTDGNWFPDVWEAEQNGGTFDHAKNASVSGDAELLGVNPKLSRALNIADFPMLETLCSKSGLALLSGIPPTKVRVIENSDGTLGILVESKVETVKVTAMDFDADGNLEIKVEAATAPIGMSAEMAELFNAKLATQKTVTCTVYRRLSLAAKDGWEKAGSKVITIGDDTAATILVSGGNASQGFYRVVIEE